MRFPMGGTLSQVNSLAHRKDESIDFAPFAVRLPHNSRFGLNMSTAAMQPFRIP